MDANAHEVQAALAKLEFFAVQDIFFSKSAEFADVVLAASPSLEKDGTFVNTERRIQRLYEAMPPLADSRPDWRILTDLARHLGHDWGYTHPSEIMDEVAAHDAALRRRHLRPPRRLPEPLLARRRRRHGHAAALHRRLPPARAARRASTRSTWTPPERAARRRVRPAPQHRPQPRALPRRQPDAPLGRAQRARAGHVRRGVRGARGRARHRDGRLGAARLAPRRGPGAGARIRPGPGRRSCGCRSRRPSTPSTTSRRATSTRTATRRPTRNWRSGWSASTARNPAAVRSRPRTTATAADAAGGRRGRAQVGARRTMPSP